MKSERKNFLRRTLEAILVLLGFSVCSSCYVAYGSPHVGYRIIGTVTDENDVPVKGIKVLINHADMDIYTDENGKFESPHASAIDLDWLTASFEDVDGEDNGGLFKSATLGIGDMQYKQVKKGKGPWYDGDYEITADVKLEKEIAD